MSRCDVSDCSRGIDCPPVALEKQEMLRVGPIQKLPISGPDADVFLVAERVEPVLPSEFIVGARPLLEVDQPLGCRDHSSPIPPSSLKQRAVV